MANQSHEEQILQPDTSMIESLQLFSNFFHLLHRDPSYIGRIIPHLNPNELDVIIPFVVFTLFANPYSEHDEFTLLQLIAVSYIHSCFP
jgi:hypothetical protein